MCNNDQFSILDGYVINYLQDDIQNNMMNNVRSIPTITMVCTKCGFLSQHALGSFAFLPKQENG